MHIREAYNQWARTYDSDRNLTRDLDHLITKDSLAHRSYASILELGCGTGKNTTLLASLGQHVHALDFSEAMIAQAQAKLRDTSVTFSLADLNQPWPRADQSAELIVCNLVLEHIADLSFIFAEAGRTLAAGGHFFISELHPFRQYQGIQAAFQHGDERTEIPAFVHHISDFLTAAERYEFTLTSLKEWWHEADHRNLPRLVSFLFQK